MSTITTIDTPPPPSGNKERDSAESPPVSEDPKTQPRKGPPAPRMSERERERAENEGMTAPVPEPTGL